MIATEFTIMNIALPSAQRSLHLSDPSRQWVITIFALGYGGFLLLGGRVSDLLGRRRSLLIGLAGFAAASAVGGAATSPAMLLSARALQGVSGALFTPASLGLLGTTFTKPAERARAFGIYGTVMGSSSGVGLILGGVITDYVGWRWSLYVAVPIALISGAGILHAVRPGRAALVPGAPGAPGGRGRIDIVGALLATVGLMGLVFGFSHAETDGWSSPVTAASLGLGVVLLVAFVAVESRVAWPLLPLRVVRHRTRGGAYLAVLTTAVGMYASIFFIIYYLQVDLGFSPARAGVAFLPFTAAIMIGVRLVARIITRVPLRLMISPGMLSIAAGLATLGLLRADSPYATGALPAIVLIGFGAGWVLIPANSVATLDAGPDAGVAGAAVMTFQQVGASLGIALLSTVAGTAAADYADSHRLAPGAGAGAARELARAADVHGYNVASVAAAVLLVVAAAAVFLLIGPRGAGAAGHAPPAPATPSEPATATASAAVAPTTAGAEAGAGAAGAGGG
jgi:MFS family permease